MSLTLDDLRATLKEWKGIEIAKDANPVLGEGNPTAEIMFVGEAPGEQEDKQGRPFVGNAGKFLNELLESIGLKREDVYVSNVVKFRPPENRDPTPEEKAACLPFLLLEISIIRPKIVVPLGRHSLAHFFAKMTIGDAHGKPQILRRAQDDSPELTVFPIYHPAAALHNPGLRQALKDDFQALGKFLESRRG